MEYRFIDFDTCNSDSASGVESCENGFFLEYMLGIDLVYCAKRNEQNLINTLIRLSIIRNIFISKYRK